VPLTVLLDVDGMLIDSNDAHASAWIDTFAEFGFQVPFSKVRELIGKGGDKLLHETIGVEQDSDLGKKLGERRYDDVADLLANYIDSPIGQRIGSAA
jgi:beta-phosphoglucomutase-like phosphatase (HAD superfamily)